MCNVLSNLQTGVYSTHHSIETVTYTAKWLCIHLSYWIQNYLRKFKITDPKMLRLEVCLKFNQKWKQRRQDPVSTKQKTGWTIHSSFLVWSRLKKSFTLDVITRGQSTTTFLYIGPFSAWWQPNNQPGDPRASLLLTSVRRQSFAIFSHIHVH